MSVPPFVLEILVICMYAAALVGLNPARNWLVLLIPLPNGSAFGPLNEGVPNSATVKYWFCQAVNASDAVTTVFNSTSWLTVSFDTVAVTPAGRVPMFNVLLTRLPV